MKRDHSLTKIMTALVSSVAMLSCAQAQTVLSGDHVVEGNLEVGTAVQKGGLTIKGETGNAASPGIRVTGDGGVLFEGTSGVGVIPVEGPGTRMMWYPKKAAFRVGEFSSGEWMWSDQYIGLSSVAFGNSWASADYSTAMSGGDAYLGSYSTAMSGGGTDGDYSTAMSGGSAGGEYSTAMSGGGAGGDYSIAMCFGEASGDYSTAIGGFAGGQESVACGTMTWASSFRSVAVGSFNAYDLNESTDTWVETDPIFIVGNGTGKSSDAPEVRQRNALVIRKNGKFEMNGDVSVSGAVRIPPQGDLSMGDFTQEPTP